MAYYSQTSQAQFTADLAQALGDPNLVFWQQDELNRALNEALLLWGALTSFWTATGNFSTVASTPFYNLNTLFPTLRTRLITYNDLCREIQYHFLEPSAVGVSGAGMTSQFTIAQIIAALKRRRNQFVIDSQVPLTFGVFAAPAPGNNLILLDQSVAVIARAAWIDSATGITTPLRRTDPFAAQAYNPLWTISPGKPYAYSQAEALPGTMNLVPPQNANGSVHITYAQTLDPTVIGSTTFAVPDEFASAIKWGAMYDLLSTHNPGYDPTRAKYCLERYRAILEASALHRTMMSIRIGARPAPLVTVDELDAGKPFWQTGTGVPQTAAAEYDLLAFYRVPKGVYSIGVDMVTAAPIPATSGSFINLGREELSYIMDYCRHILSWKMGGAEFVSTLSLHDSFLAGAAKRNSLLSTKVRYLVSLFQQGDETDAQVA